ncbi:ABC transporter permease [Alkalicoccus luteus]|uniref:ABC transporter permease n=1 Tax=Alkalicoccus luteus TaxID=1237094 RepID=UPI004034F5F2
MRTGIGRIKLEWKDKIAIWRMVIDWTVALYIVVPILAIGGYYYAQLWQGNMEHLFTWMTPFRWSFLLLIIIHAGTLRLFVVEADMLFLRKFPAAFQRIKRTGVVYTLLLNGGMILLFAIALVPVWTVYGGYSAGWILSVLAAAFVAKITAQTTKQLLDVRYERGKLYAMNTVVTFLFTGVYIGLVFAPIWLTLLGSLFLAGAAAYLIRMRLREDWAFSLDCLREMGQRINLSAFFLQQSGTQEKPKKYPRKKPMLLFTESEGFFKEPTNDKRLFEWFMKRWLRSKMRMLVYAQFFILFTIAIAVAPFYIKWLLLVLCTTIVVYTTYQMWLESWKHPFMKLLKRHESTDMSVPIRQAVGVITLPAAAVFGFFAGATSIGLWAGLVTAALMISIIFFLFIKPPSKAVLEKQKGDVV